MRRSKKEKGAGDFSPTPQMINFLKSEGTFDPAEQSAKAESQLPQILPLYKANSAVGPINNSKLTGVINHSTHLLSFKERKTG